MLKRSVFVSLLIGLWPLGSIFFVGEVHAQNTSEIGAGIGGLVYKGEVAPNYRFENNRPGGAIFYRKDISRPVTLKANLMGGWIRANDENVDLPVNNLRQAAIKTNLIELSAGLEYNFLDYYDQRRRTRWTPYYFIGIAITNYENKVIWRDQFTKRYANGFVMAIPSGIGFKYALSYHWNLGLEAGARKTLAKNSDRLDYLPARGPSRGLLLTDPYDDDWYFYNGVSISYTFYKLLCPPASQSSSKKARKKARK